MPAIPTRKRKIKRTEPAAIAPQPGAGAKTARKTAPKGAAAKPKAKAKAKR